MPLLPRPGIPDPFRGLGAAAARLEPGALADLIRQRHPDAWALYNTLDEEGYPRRVIEAIAEGVSLTSLEHSAAAVSLAVLRPNLLKVEKAKAVLHAFGYQGRPYDYEFDFLTDAALVCSELAYKCYEPGEGSRGLDMPLDQVAGRTITPPNALAERYDAEQGTPGQQTELVLFLDGYERGGVAGGG